MKYFKDTLMENYSKMKNYFKIERDSNEKMRDFVIRYEKAESECRKAVGKSMFEGKAKGFHVLEQANLTENQKQMVLLACGQGKLEYGKPSQIMKRIFEGLGSKEGSEGHVNLGRGRGNYGRGRGNRGRNPVNREGKVTLCVICKSEWHWARHCPENIQNIKKVESGQEKEEKVCRRGEYS